MAATFRTVKDSTKSSHQEVVIDGVIAGVVWREFAHVVVSKLTEPRRLEKKLRWFAQREGESRTLGKGTQAAMLLGAGFRSRAAAVEAIIHKA